MDHCFAIKIICMLLIYLISFTIVKYIQWTVSSLGVFRMSSWVTVELSFSSSEGSHTKKQGKNEEKIDKSCFVIYGIFVTFVVMKIFRQ